MSRFVKHEIKSSDALRRRADIMHLFLDLFAAPHMLKFYTFWGPVNLLGGRALPEVWVKSNTVQSVLQSALILCITDDIAA